MATPPKKKRKATQDLLGRFRANPNTASNPGPVTQENIRASRTESVDNRVGRGDPFANRTPQLDPVAVRIAARSFINRMPDPTTHHGDPWVETPQDRELRVTRLAKRWMDDGATGDSIQRALRMPVAEVQARAAAQGANNGRGAVQPGDPPLLYK